MTYVDWLVCMMQEKWQTDEEKVDALQKALSKMQQDKIRDAQMQRAIAEQRIAAQV